MTHRRVSSTDDLKDLEQSMALLVDDFHNGTNGTIDIPEWYIDAIKTFEGKPGSKAPLLTPQKDDDYLAKKGQLVIGWGHKTFDPTLIITVEQAEAFLQEDMENSYNEVHKIIEKHFDGISLTARRALQISLIAPHFQMGGPKFSLFKDTFAAIKAAIYLPSDENKALVEYHARHSNWAKQTEHRVVHWLGVLNRIFDKEDFATEPKPDPNTTWIKAGETLGGVAYRIAKDKNIVLTPSKHAEVVAQLVKINKIADANKVQPYQVIRFEGVFPDDVKEPPSVDPLLDLGSDTGSAPKILTSDRSTSKSDIARFSEKEIDFYARLKEAGIYDPGSENAELNLHKLSDVPLEEGDNSVFPPGYFQDYTNAHEAAVAEARELKIRSHIDGDIPPRQDRDAATLEYEQQRNKEMYGGDESIKLLRKLIKRTEETAIESPKDKTPDLWKGKGYAYEATATKPEEDPSITPV